MVVVLPAPLGPSRPKHSPGADLEVEAVDGDDVAVGLAKLAMEWPTRMIGPFTLSRKLCRYCESLAMPRSGLGGATTG